jgi:hypothetical protein
MLRCESSREKIIRPNFKPRRAGEPRPKVIPKAAQYVYSFSGGAPRPRDTMINSLAQVTGLTAVPRLMRCRSVVLLLDACTTGRLSRGYRKVQARICNAGATPHMARLNQGRGFRV